MVTFQTHFHTNLFLIIHNLDKPNLSPSTYSYTSNSHKWLCVTMSRSTLCRFRVTNWQHSTDDISVHFRQKSRFGKIKPPYQRVVPTNSPPKGCIIFMRFSRIHNNTQDWLLSCAQSQSNNEKRRVKLPTAFFIIIFRLNENWAVPLGDTTN